MELAILLSKLNIENQTGGPFGAAIFNLKNHRLISIGINLVVTNHCSSHHAEMVALTLAQQHFHSFSLNAEHLPHCELVSSCEPCAMCFGAIPWSGVKSLLSGATATDAEAIGFDEGPKHPNWIDELQNRGITVTTAFLRTTAANVLQEYHQQQGTIYNGAIFSSRSMLK